MDIVNIYYECLNKSYKDDSLEPLLNSVYKIINYYDWELTEIMGIEGDTAIYIKIPTQFTISSSNGMELRGILIRQPHLCGGA